MATTMQRKGLPEPVPEPALSLQSEDIDYDEQKPLNTFDVACLIINKMIGSGIFVQPAVVLALTGTNWGAILLWAFGALYSYASIYVYLEYGQAWPYTGGEFVYIKKIFPRSALLLASSFAWFFVCFSNTSGNALIFARYLCLLKSPYPPSDTVNLDEWLQKFIACWTVVGVSLIHYRTVNIGIDANRFLAGYKILFLLILILAGFAGGLPNEAKSGEVSGAKDYGELFDHSQGPVPIVLAFFLVLYSYQGWENANYVISEIEGNVEQRKKTLKRGAFWAISLVSTLYILFNITLFFLLEHAEITDDPLNTIYYFSLKVCYYFYHLQLGRNYQLEKIKETNGAYRHSSPSIKRLYDRSVFFCTAMSACGNLVGVIFTNARVKREIAKHQLIPGYKFFSKSSKHGVIKDGLGTPIGGLILHGIVSCIIIIATPMLQSSIEGLSFIISLYLYGHTVHGVVLGFGLFFLKKRMNEDETEVIDLPGEAYDVPWHYKLLQRRSFRYLTASFFILVNSFLAIAPFVPTKNPNGTPRRIPNWNLPTSTLPVYAVGALASVVIVIISPRMYFKTSTGRSRAEFVPYSVRRWINEYPSFMARSKDEQNLGIISSLRARGRSQIIADTKERLWNGGEAREAKLLRGNLELEPLVVTRSEG